MSGVVKGIGKVFKATVVKPIKFVLKQDHKVAMKIWHTPILRYAAIAVAAYFTAGAALGWFSAAGAAGGTAGATAVAASGTAAGGSFFAGTAAGAAVGGSALAGSATATTLATVSVTAVGGAAATGVTTAGIIGAASVGAAAGAAAQAAAGSNAQNAMKNGDGSVNAVTNNGTTLTGVDGTKDGLGVTNLPASTSTAPMPPPEPIVTPSNSALADTIASGVMIGTAEAFKTPNIQQATETDNVADDGEKKPNIFKRGIDKVKDYFSSPNVDENGVATGGRHLSDSAKLMLVQSGLQVASAMLQKPQRPLQYAGVNARGNGPGLNIHTINGGFGLATGGQGEPAPGGVPDALLPPGSAGAYSGAGMSNAALASTNQTPGNLGQAAANNAGVGGLIPQGAVNYMGTPG